MEAAYRLAEAGDAGAIARIVQENLGEDLAPRKVSASLVKEKMKDRKDVFVVAVSDGAIIGASRASFEDLDLAEIRWLVVSKEHRNSGIGTMLVEKTLEALRARGKRKVTARVRSASAAPIEIFSRLGFEKEGYFRDHYRRGVDIIQFGRFL